MYKDNCVNFVNNLHNVIRLSAYTPCSIKSSQNLFYTIERTVVCSNRVIPEFVHPRNFVQLQNVRKNLRKSRSGNNLLLRISILFSRLRRALPAWLLRHFLILRGSLSSTVASPANTKSPTIAGGIARNCCS